MPRRTTWTMAAAAVGAAVVPAAAQADTYSCTASALVTGLNSGPTCTIDVPSTGRQIRGHVEVTSSPLGVGVAQGRVTAIGLVPSGSGPSVGATCGPAINHCGATTPQLNGAAVASSEVVCSGRGSLAIGYVVVYCTADVL